jgi:membrane fusion protein, multidrug efflux system
MMHDNPIPVGGHPVDDTASPARGKPSSIIGRIVVFGVMAAAVAGLFLLYRARTKAAVGAAAAAASAAANRVIPVLTAQVAQRDMPLWLEGLGSVSAFYTVTVKTQVGGPIVKVLYKEGQHVKKGDVLLQIDPRPFNIQLESAQAALQRDQANLKNSQVNMDRYKTLSDQKLIAVQQYTDQQSSVDQLMGTVASDKAAIDQANLNLDYAQIKSPIDGVTGVRLVDPGNFVQPTDTNGLVVVTQLDPIALYFTLPEDDLGSIEKGMAEGTLTVQAWSRAGDKLLGEGKLTVIDNQINQATATLRLKAIFDNPKGLLWPNQFVKAKVHISTRQAAIVVPNAVVQHGPSGTFAYVVEGDSTVSNRAITVDAVQSETAIVSKGLQPGDTVVVEGQAQLRPGTHVSAKPAPSGSASSGGSPVLGAPAPSATAPASPAAGQAAGAKP